MRSCHGAVFGVTGTTIDLSGVDDGAFRMVVNTSVVTLTGVAESLLRWRDGG